MDIIETALPDVKLLRPARREDFRGWFTESWSQATLAAAGIPSQFSQENLAFSRAAGTMRGLHYQVAPAAQGKLIQVIRGAIFDAVVDLRRGSPHFARHAAVELRQGDGMLFWAPPGFAHGYLTLEPDTEVIYRVTAPYAPNTERGLRWNDPALGISWPATPALIITERDRDLPLLADLGADFQFVSPA
jgi:dTDP-4-dehydrorhamnose 3,5-epimerase